jgi:hypothetical protein
MAKYNQPVEDEIIQIIAPTIPTWAEYSEDDGRNFTEQVHLWALVKNIKGEGVQGVMGLHLGNLKEGGFIEDDSNFLGYQDSPILPGEERKNEERFDWDPFKK